jgi:3-hydroxybutyryl-CoA dehydratase
MIGRSIRELVVGQTAELKQTITTTAIRDFAETVGDDNPLHADGDFARRVSFREPIAPGILTAGLISAVIGTQLPGPGTLYISQDLRFLKPVYPGDTITARAEVVEIMEGRNRVRLRTWCVNQANEEVLVGEAWVKPPKERIVYERPTESLAGAAQ